MHARSALFDLYGDHLADRGSWAPIAGTVRLLGTVEVAAPAVRTAVSRLVREGWLRPAERGGQRGYAATARAQERLAEARSRIYRTGPHEWDGRWHLVVTVRGPERAARARSVAALGYLGYARLAPDTWIAPRESAELERTLVAEGVHTRRFHARYDTDPRQLAATLWDLTELGAAYDRFLARVRALQRDLPADMSTERAFAERTMLVHEWRKFLFRDPGLPAPVLPGDWPGHEAARVFDEVAAALRPLAGAFVDDCLRAQADPHPASPPPRVQDTPSRRPRRRVLDQ